MKRTGPICPSCGKPSRSVATRNGWRNDCRPCGLWSWGDKPLVNARTHRARRIAHAVFDVLWKHKFMDRTDAYKHLMAAMGMDRKDCHMRLMDAEQAERVPGAVRRIVEEQGIDLCGYVGLANDALRADRLPTLRLRETA